MRMPFFASVCPFPCVYLPEVQQVQGCETETLYAPFCAQIEAYVFYTCTGCGSDRHHDRPNVLWHHSCFSRFYTLPAMHTCTSLSECPYFEREGAFLALYGVKCNKYKGRVRNGLKGACRAKERHMHLYGCREKQNGVPDLRLKQLQTEGQGRSSEAYPSEAPSTLVYYIIIII